MKKRLLITLSAMLTLMLLSLPLTGMCDLGIDPPEDPGSGPVLPK